MKALMIFKAARASRSVRRPLKYAASSRFARCTSCARMSWSPAVSLVRCFFETLKKDVPALAIGPRPAGQRGREAQVERRNVPALLGPAGFERHTIGLEQVLGRIVVAVRVLDAVVDRELAPRPHVDLELADAVDEVVVDPLGVLAVGFAARLPVPFQDVMRVPRHGGELRRRVEAGQRGRDAHTGKKPGKPERRTHGTPFGSRAVKHRQNTTVCAGSSGPPTRHPLLFRTPSW